MNFIDYFNVKVKVVSGMFNTFRMFHGYFKHVILLLDKFKFSSIHANYKFAMYDIYI